MPPRIVYLTERRPGVPTNRLSFKFCKCACMLVSSVAKVSEGSRGDVSDRRFLLLAWTALVAFVTIAVLATAYSSVTILFSTLLCAIGIYAGYLCTIYIARKSTDISLTRYASAGHRLSLDVHDALQEVVDTLRKTQGTRDANTLRVRIEVAMQKLITIQRFALSSNQQWEEMLPPDKIRETRERETRLPLQDGRVLIVTEKEGRLLCRGAGCGYE
jgi:hypothetical protein